MSNDKSIRDVKDYLKKHRTPKKILDLFARLSMHVVLGVNPRYWKFLSDRRYRLGFLEGSILQNPLYVPSQDGCSLKMEKTLAGQWVGYDFERVRKYGEKFPHSVKGKLYTFSIDEVENHPSDMFTSSDILEFFDINHLLSLDAPGIEIAEKEGLVERVTYGEAYDSAGLYGRYESALGVLNVLDDEVYRITPKGNTLVFLGGDGGDKIKKEKKARLPVWAPS